MELGGTYWLLVSRYKNLKTTQETTVIDTFIVYLLCEKKLIKIALNV